VDLHALIVVRPITNSMVCRWTVGQGVLTCRWQPDSSELTSSAIRTQLTHVSDAQTAQQIVVGYSPAPLNGHSAGSARPAVVGAA
jgi:hypothetical protein